MIIDILHLDIFEHNYYNTINLIKKYTLLEMYSLFIMQSKKIRIIVKRKIQNKSLFSRGQLLIIKLSLID